MRGIGVAVITSTSGASPLVDSASRWCTPKRCCSSTTTRPSRRNHAGLEERMRADGDLRLPGGDPLQRLARAPARGPCRSGARPRCRLPPRAARWWKNAGGPEARSAPSAPPGRRPRRHAPWRSARRSSCRSRHRPAAAAACGSRRRGRARSRQAPARCDCGQAEGQGAFDTCAKPSVRPPGGAAPALQAAAHQHQRELARDELVEGEPLPGRARRRRPPRCRCGLWMQRAAPREKPASCARRAGPAKAIRAASGAARAPPPTARRSTFGERPAVSR